MDQFYRHDRFARSWYPFDPEQSMLIAVQPLLIRIARGEPSSYISDMRGYVLAVFSSSNIVCSWLQLISHLGHDIERLRQYMFWVVVADVVATD